MMAAHADTQLWMKVGYKKIIPKTHIKITQHLRLEDNATAIESIIPEGALFGKAYLSLMLSQAIDCFGVALRMILLSLHNVAIWTLKEIGG